MSTARQELEEAKRFGLLDDVPDLQLHGTDAAYATQSETEEESESDVVTISISIDDPLLLALMQATGQSGKSIIERALHVGTDFLRLEAMEALTQRYELKVKSLEERLKTLKSEAMAAETPVMPPKSPLKRFWSMLNTPKED